MGIAAAAVVNHLCGRFTNPRNQPESVLIRVFLSPTALHWSLYGVPEQTERPETEEVYWELQKFLVLALKANPNVLECLYTPLVEMKSELAGELLAMRAMHLIRLLLAGITILTDGFVPLQIGPHREQLLAIRRGELPWDEVNNWRLDLHHGFQEAFRATSLPESPDYERANEFLLKARRSMAA